MCDEGTINSFDLSENCTRMSHLSSEHNMATNEETDVASVENNTFQYDELTKTDHRLQQPKGTINSKLSDFFTAIPSYRPKASDAVDESNKTECVSSPHGKVRYVLYHSQSSIEYSGFETLGNITTSVISQDEILTSLSSVMSQDDIFNNIRSTISQRGILKNITAPTIPYDELLKNRTATTTQDEIRKHITTSSRSEDEMLPGLMSTNKVAEHSLMEHFCYEEPNCLLKTFSEQLSITCQMPTDEVSIDGLNEDNNEENPTQMYNLGYSENRTTFVNELQRNNDVQLLERGQCEQNAAPGRGTTVTPYTRRPTVEQLSGFTCSRPIQGHRMSTTATPVPRITETTLGMSIPVELCSIPNRHNEYILQVNPAATGSKLLSNDADTLNFYSSSGGPTRQINSSLESSSAVATTTSSPSSIISDTEGQFLTTDRFPPSKDAWMHHKNDYIQAMHNDARKHSQTKEPVGIKTGSHFSKQHFVQSKQQNLPVMNSDSQQYTRPSVNEHKMLDPSLCMQQWNYDLPPMYLPDLRLLCNAYDTDQTTSRRQHRSIVHETGCHQKDTALQMNTVRDTSQKFYNSFKDNSYLIPRGPQYHQTNQHSYSNNSIPCVNRSQVNTCASTDTSLTSVGPPQSKHTQLVYVGNNCLAQNHLAQNHHIIQGQCRQPVDHEIACKSNLYSRHKKSEPPLQQSHKGSHDLVVHASAEASTEGLVTGTTQMCHSSTGTSKSQSKHSKTRMDKVNKWLQDEKNMSMDERLRLHEHNNNFNYKVQDSQQGHQQEEQTPRPTHIHAENSGLPRGLFDGKPLPDAEQEKQSLNKKYNPHNACRKKHPSPKDAQKNKAQTEDRNDIFKSSLQFQHYNNTAICNVHRPELPTNGLCSDMMIERIRQKQLPKYKSSVVPDCPCCQANVQKADAVINEDIKLRDEKSLKEPLLGLPISSSDRENLDKELLHPLPHRTNSPRATSSSSRNKGEMSQTVDVGKHCYRQLHCDPMGSTHSDNEIWLKQMSRKENDALVCRQEDIQTCNENKLAVQENTRASCWKQSSHKYCDDTAGKCGARNSLNCESSFPYAHLHHDKHNAELSRLHVYTQEANHPKELGLVSYGAPNDQTTGCVKLQYEATGNQTTLSTLQKHEVPSDYIQKYGDNTSVEQVTGRQFVDVNQRTPPPISGSRNIHSNHTQIHSYENARFLPPDLPKNCGKHSAIPCHTINAHSHNVMSQYILHSFQNNQRPSLLSTTQTCESQSVSKTQSNANQRSYAALPSSHTSFVMTTPPCFVGSASSSQSLQESPFKMPYNVDQYPHDAHRHYYQTVQTEPYYPSISAGSDVSMSSDNSLSRAHIVNISATENMQRYHQNIVCKDTLPTCYQLQYQGLQITSQQTQKQNHNLQLHLENQNHKDTQQENRCLHQRDQQIVSQDRNDFSKHGSTGAMHLPCFLQSADCDDDITPCGSTNQQLISPHLLNQMANYQNIQCPQSETLESIMTSISEKSQMSTSTSNDCYPDKTHASEQLIKDTLNECTHQCSNNTANLSCSHVPQASSKAVSSHQQPSDSPSNVTNRPNNVGCSIPSHFPEAIADVFPQLDFEDCRDAIPLSPQSSPDIQPIQTLTKPDQVLVTNDRQGEHTGNKEPTLKNCKHKNVEPLPYTNAGAGTSSSACDTDSQQRAHLVCDAATKDADILSDISFLEGLQDDLNTDNKDQQIEDILRDLER